MRVTTVNSARRCSSFHLLDVPTFMVALATSPPPTICCWSELPVADERQQIVADGHPEREPQRSHLNSLATHAAGCGADGDECTDPDTCCDGNNCVSGVCVQGAHPVDACAQLDRVHSVRQAHCHRIRGFNCLDTQKLTHLSEASEGDAFSLINPKSLNVRADQ
jgi:hypothetical protein